MAETQFAKYMTVRKTAREYGLSEHMLRTMIKKEECPGFYAGNRFMINVDLLQERLANESRKRSGAGTENWYNVSYDKKVIEAVRT